MREKKKVHVIDRLSSNSLILVGKVTGDKVVFIRVLVFVFVFMFSLSDNNAPLSARIFLSFFKEFVPSHLRQKRKCNPFQRNRRDQRRLLLLE